jgi:hypothetical protein
MRPLLMICIIAVVVFPPLLHGQQFTTRSVLIFRSTILTSSRVFNNPEAVDIVDRDHYDFVDNLLGGGIEYRLEFPEQNVFVSISAEYVSRVRSQQEPFLTTGNNLVQLAVEQGVRFIPVEIGVGTNVPVSKDILNLTMGGGFGVYYADRVFGIDKTMMRAVTPPVGYGIHIEMGFVYRAFKDFGLTWEMRFRDPEVTNESRFDTQFINVNNDRVSVQNIPPKSKVNIHGVSFSVGLTYDLH